MWSRIVILVIALVALPLGAAPKREPAGKAGKGFWKVLVTPKARWVLSHGKATVTVETYDVRKVGDADVARLRWTYRDGDGDTREVSDNLGLFTQVAVTPAGLYLLDKGDDDGKIAKALAGKPSRSDPPKPYKGTKLNNGRYLTVEGEKVCMGTGPEPGAGDCPDVCDGRVCMTSEGIVELFGTYSPDEDIFTAK